jgi:cytochrome b6-f complex iron-sulfur subunit
MRGRGTASDGGGSRRLRRYVADLLRGRRPRPFPADADEAAQIRTAITLRAARPGSGAPTEEFLAALHRRLGAELDGVQRSGQTTTSRRRVVQLASAAAAAGAVGAAGGAALDRALTDGDGTGSGGSALNPNTGVWHPVADSAELPSGAVRPFDTGTVIGFVTRDGDRVRAVSGICSHRSCRLALDQPAGELTCPCHNAAFTLGGAVVRHQLRVAPPALPTLTVRERNGVIEVYSP